MSPRITRALTAALAIAGAAGAIALPTLSLGPAKAPTHSFALPAATGDLVIESEALPTVSRPRPDRRSNATASPKPAAQTAVVVASAPRTLPSATARPAAPAPAKAVQMPVAPPLAVPTPTPAPQPKPEPQPQPLPQAEPAAPAPSAVRHVTSYAPVAVQPGDADSKKHKPKKDKSAQENRGKQKHEPAPKPEPALPVADPLAVEPVLPVEPSPTETEQGEETKHDDADGGKEHGGHGKGHDKKK